MDEHQRKIDPLQKVWDPEDRIGDMLKGKRGLVVGVSNEHSIAYGCAAKFRGFGAELALTYLNEKAKPFVAPLAAQIESKLLLPLDVEQPGALETVFEAIAKEWGRLDFVLHSIAFAPSGDLHGRLVDSSREGFEQAMRVSVHSFIEMARLAEPLMTEGGALLTMSYYGAEKVVNHYNMMGPVKAALESTTRYLAAELAAKHIRVYALSPGPIRTRAAGGIADFNELVDMAESRGPGKRLVDIAEIGRVAAFLVGGAASGMTGDTIYVDAGLHIMA
ncbi:enoyl-[acyl-carrier protein] reductase I [Rhodoblastus sphagnicola]|nr:enoyl-ACP reductase FabI [Rhodoblastus sphagnicola]MBB4196533.1 enoyl-[acyl-carrier protein] reductase I [Rhodoblastus sphagnicola]